MRRTIFWVLMSGIMVAGLSIFASARLVDLGEYNFIYWLAIFTFIFTVIYYFFLHSLQGISKLKSSFIYFALTLLTSLVVYYGVSLYLLSKLS